MKKQTKKQTKKVCAITAAICAAALGFSACGGGEKNILVVSREDGSGTRAAFEEIVQKDGVKLQDASLVKDMELASTTGTVISKVETNKTGIGYASLSSVGDSVKKLKVGGVEATAENVRNGSYAMKRPFILLTPVEYTLSATAQDFFEYCTSEEAKDEIVAAGCIEAGGEYAAYETPEGSVRGTVKVEGSTSMKDLLIALIGEYKKVQPGVTVEATYNGSSNGRSAVQNDSTGSTLGLASSAKASEKYVEHTLCYDAIAVIVNTACTLDEISVAQLFDIYTGEIKKFSELTAA